MVEERVLQSTLNRQTTQLQWLREEHARLQGTLSEMQVSDNTRVYLAVSGGAGV